MIGATRVPSVSGWQDLLPCPLDSPEHYARHHPDYRLFSCGVCGVDPCGEDELLELIEAGQIRFRDEHEWLFDVDTDPSPHWLRDRVPSHQWASVLRRIAGELFDAHRATVAARLAYCWARQDTELPRAVILRIIDDVAKRQRGRRTA